MKKLALIAVLLTILCVSAGADAEDGFAWMEWDLTEKAWYVKGVSDAIEMMQLFSVAATKDEEATNAMFAPYPGTVGDIIGEIDLFYLTYTNRESLIVLVILNITGNLEAWARAAGFEKQ